MREGGCWVVKEKWEDEEREIEKGRRRGWGEDGWKRREGWVRGMKRIRLRKRGGR